MSDKTINLTYGYNSTKAAVVGIWKNQIGGYKDQRTKVNEKISTATMHWLCHLITYAAAEHFIKDGKPAYSDKLANSFNEFLFAEVGIESEAQRDKYSSAISACLGIRKCKVEVPALFAVREVAISDGAVGVLNFLDKLDIKTFNTFLSKVQPGSDKMAQLASRVANLNDEQRRRFEKFLEAAMVKAAKKKAKEAKAGAGKSNGHAVAV